MSRSIPRAPTIRTVAERAGVSKSLVSLVLQGSPKVADHRREAVMRAMAELGYRPNTSARSLAERRTRTVGVVIDDLANPWYVDLLTGLRPVLHKQGLRPVLADGRTEPDAVNAMAELRVEGLLLVGTPSESVVEQVNELKADFALVVAGTRESRLSSAHVVANDDEDGARGAAQHLVELGHTRIAHIVGEGEVGRLRRQGFESELRRSGLSSIAADGDWTEATGHDIGRKLLNGPERPTAIFAANDLSAVGVLDAADDLGIRVPEDLSVIGYDNTVFAKMQRLALTTIDPHVAEVGRVAGTIMLESLDREPGSGEAVSSAVLVAPTLVARRSTAAPA